MKTNLILATDSYKLVHPNMYKPSVTKVFSYMEARTGGAFTSTVFAGLQPILAQYLEGSVITQADIDEAAMVSKAHFGTDEYFNRDGWEYILHTYGGRLPIRIKAVPEGTIVHTGNVLVTIENLDPKVPWLTNAVESILLHVWYPTTVATLSAAVKTYLIDKCKLAGGKPEDSNFMLHDFGYRGASSHESAGIGGFGHLINFFGTDTLEAMRIAHMYYNAPYSSLAFSVAASEHSIMTQQGFDGEHQILKNLINSPTFRGQILSLVADSYNVYDFVMACIALDEDIIKNEVRLVIRPDSVTPQHPTPETLMVNILTTIYENVAGSTFIAGMDGKSYILLPSRYRVIWGDGIDINGIKKIVEATMAAGFAPQNMIFGMGGGLLQKVNRDTCRFAVKASAIQHENSEVWVPVYKSPLGGNKTSKAGRLTLVQTENNGTFITVNMDTIEGQHEIRSGEEMLVTVFDSGWMKNQTTLDEIRSRADVSMYPVYQSQSIEN